MNIEATYSPEDNKIRLTADSRLDQGTFERVKEAGFRWAPRQELFVAPRWTPEREDLALELAGEITAESSTMAERAADKAARLEAIAGNRSQQSDAFRNAAESLSERFAQGQPILIGHHSERRARRDAEKAENNARKAFEAHKAVSYWLYKASAVEHHANRKNAPKVRQNRIKTLLTELRKHQSELNSAAWRLSVLAKVNTEAMIRHVVGNSSLAPYGLFSDLSSDRITYIEAKTRMVNSAQAVLDSPSRRRWIAHILNRLSYERELLGPVERFTGEMTPAVIQVFVRTHGADKPKAAHISNDDSLWTLQCAAPLPLHLGTSDYAEMSGEEWRDLMQSVGYEVAEKRPAKPPILNFHAMGQLSVINPWQRSEMLIPIVSMTKATYSKISTDQRGTRLSTCGNFRVKTCPNPSVDGPRYKAGWCAVFLTDSKVHDMPESARVVK